MKLKRVKVERKSKEKRIYFNRVKKKVKTKKNNKMINKMKIKLKFKMIKVTRH